MFFNRTILTCLPQADPKPVYRRLIPNLSAAGMITNSKYQKKIKIKNKKFQITKTKDAPPRGAISFLI
tara:strand:- start:185 stop:388 length:204 start_codon:yes stop_codon:yes gene_type:complete